MIFLNVFIVILGLALGSFLHTAAFRLQRGRSILPGSICDHCQEPLGWKALVPVLGYLVLRGRCERCGERISVFYPLLEIFNGFLLWLIFRKTGWQLEFIHAALIFELFLLIAVIDFQSHLIYPQPIVIGLVIHSAWIFYSPNADLQGALLGLFVGAGLFHWIAYLYKVLRNRVGLGDGDATVLGLIGFVLGWKALFSVIFWGAVFGILGGGIILLLNRQSFKHEIAFGPWLVLAAFFAWYFSGIFQVFPFRMPDIEIPFF